MNDIRCTDCGAKIADRCLSETAFGLILGSRCEGCTTVEPTPAA